MNYLQKKKLAFMSIVNRVKGFVRTITGTLPLTLEGCVDEESIIDYTLYGQSVQNGTPTPETPVEVESVGEKTTNLINWDLILSNKSITKVENGYYSTQYSIGFGNTTDVVKQIKSVLKPDTTYTLSRVYDGVMNASNGFIYLATANGATVVSCPYGRGLKSATFSLTQEEIDSIQRLYIIFAGGGGTISNLQLTESDTVLPYEPYRYKIPIKVSGNGEPITTNIYLDEPLRKVGDYADYVDLENGKVVRNVKEVVLDGGENWVAHTTKTVTQVFRNDDIYFRPSPEAYFCDKFIVANPGDTEKIAITEHMYIAVNKTRANNVTDFKKWLSENPTVVAYPLATPTETPITLPPIPTFKGTSIISADTTIQPSNAEIEYYSNVKE